MSPTFNLTVNPHVMAVLAANAPNILYFDGLEAMSHDSGTCCMILKLIQREPFYIMLGTLGLSMILDSLMPIDAVECQGKDESIFTRNVYLRYEHGYLPRYRRGVTERRQSD